MEWLVLDGLGQLQQEVVQIFVIQILQLLDSELADLNGAKLDVEQLQRLDGSVRPSGTDLGGAKGRPLRQK